MQTLRSLLLAAVVLSSFSAAHAMNASRAARAPLFKASAEGQDTLEVHVLYVQFKEESAGEDVATTTGLGTFGSAGKGKADSDKKQEYKLDPNGPLRKYKFYLERHFEFAQNYFESVSKGRVRVEHRIHPAPDDDGLITPLQLDRTMRQYNPSELDKESKQKTSDFNEERAQRLMTFVSEAVRKADELPDTQNPFKAAFAPLPAGSRRHRCFMIFHAGHSRLLDGGQLGAFGADTPNDFTDFFVTKPDFKYLAKATENAKPDGKPVPDLRKDSLGVRLKSVDTVVSELMMVSESASQDKLNWGINGILVNQLARQMGMPDMFDVVQGISQLGSFDLMDFAGANSENGRGFLPVYPSAWVRYFMGWEDPVVARPGTGTPGGGGAYADYRIFSPTSGNGADRPTTVKVPLNDREYLLIENRQRADARDSIKVYFADTANSREVKFSKRDSVTVPFAFADSLFLDSLCDNRGRNCKPNTRRPRGIITGASTYDLALPGSGLLVWRVNEWFIEQFLKFGAVNAWLGDTLRAQYKGVELVEADGSLTIGKTFTDPLGQPAFDYGSGSDIFPHIRRRRVKPPKDTAWRAEYDTLRVIGPYGQANTNAWNDGRTHLRLEGIIPEKALLEKGMSSFLGDSVFTVRDTAITLRVHWPDNRAIKQSPGWEWPAKADTATTERSLAVARAGGTKVVVSLSDNGLVQAFTPAGRRAIEARDTLRPNASDYDSVFTLLPGSRSRDDESVPVSSLVARPLSRAVGSAVLGDSLLVVLTEAEAAAVALRPDSLAARSRDSSAQARITLGLKDVTAGPVVAGSHAWYLHGGTASSLRADGEPGPSFSLGDGPWQSLAVLPRNGSVWDLVAAGAGGRAAYLEPASGRASALNLPWGRLTPTETERFTVTTSDFDRDGSLDAFFLGSKGSALLVGLENPSAPRAFPGYPQRFQRNVRFEDTVFHYESEDPTGPALADLNRDGHPDILFSGSNAVHAVDFRGAYLKGWPFQPEPRQTVGFTHGSAAFPATALRSTPLVASLDGHPTVFLATPDGLIYAVDSAGRRLTGSSHDPAAARQTGVLSTDLSDWPLTMGGLSLDTTTRNPYIHLTLADIDGDEDLELLAQSGTGTLSAWTLKGARTAPGLAWTASGGDLARSGHLDPATLGSRAAAGTEESIREFWLFPSPLRGTTATVHLRLGAQAKKARVRVYDLAGNVVKDHGWTGLTEGLQAYTQALDLRHLGPDVYTALVEVWFDGGKKTKKERIGVIR